MKSIFDCVIIGSGPAGMTAAIYLKRANVNFTIIEQSAPGGQMLRTSSIENYPGFKSIDGASLAQAMYEQLENLNVNYRYGKVTKINKQDSAFIITTDVETIKTKTIILATGREPKHLNIKDEEKFIGKGISYCATCDGTLYKNKDVGVIGGANTAIEEAIYLSSLCNQVYLFYRKDNLKGEEILQEQLKTTPNITVLYNTTIEELLSNENKLIGVKTNNNETYNIEGLFIFIGQLPTLFYQIDESLELENGYIKVNDKMETSIKGIYAVGDIIKKDYYQITTAVSEGTIAALNVKKQTKE